MIPSAETAPPRYSTRSFPSYRYIPGETPHPTRDPCGHSYNKPVEKLSAFIAEHWQSCEEYLFGIDLYNYRYWWEAHEALEAVWVAAGRRTETGLFLQGLIQVATAHLKKYQGLNDVAKRMASKGLGKMKSIKGIYLGIDVDTFCNNVESYFSGESENPIIIELTDITRYTPV